jgi:Tol biopolymer transport system component
VTARIRATPSRYSTPAGGIVFSSSRDGDYDLYVMLADGTDPVQVTNIPEGETNASWASPT